MKAKIKKTGEIIDVRRNDEGLYIQETEPIQWRYPHELEILGYTFEEVEEIEERIRKQYESGINWEQRRYEIAKTVIHGQLTGSIIPGVGPNPSMTDLAKWSVNIADVLIAELKEGGKL